MVYEVISQPTEDMIFHQHVVMPLFCFVLENLKPKLKFGLEKTVAATVPVRYDPPR